MKAEEFAEELENEGFWSVVFDDMFWKNEFDSKACLNILLAQASLQSLVLADIELFDHDSWFYKSYKSSEKGLS